MPLPDSVT